MAVNWKFVIVFKLKSGQVMYLNLLWLSGICIWSQNVYLGTNPAVPWEWLPAYLGHFMMVFW